MLQKTDFDFQSALDKKFDDMYEIYDNLREEFLDFARERGLEIEYEYENQSDREIPDTFRFFDRQFSLRETKFFQLLTLGSLDNMREIFDSPELYAIYLEEVFGTIDDYIRESQINAELGDERNELEKEAA